MDHSQCDFLGIRFDVCQFLVGALQRVLDTFVDDSKLALEVLDVKTILYRGHGNHGAMAREGAVGSILVGELR